MKLHIISHPRKPRAAHPKSAFGRFVVCVCERRRIISTLHRSSEVIFSGNVPQFTSTCICPWHGPDQIPCISMCLAVRTRICHGLFILFIFIVHSTENSLCYYLNIEILFSVGSVSYVLHPVAGQRCPMHIVCAVL